MLQLKPKGQWFYGTGRKEGRGCQRKGQNFSKLRLLNFWKSERDWTDWLKDSRTRSSHYRSVGWGPNVVSVRMWVQSLASLSGLSTWHCPELWYRLQMQLGSGIAAVVKWASSCSADLTPSMGTVIWHRYSTKKQKKKNFFPNFENLYFHFGGSFLIIYIDLAITGKYEFH